MGKVLVSLIFAMLIWDPTANLILTNISSNTIHVCRLIYMYNLIDMAGAQQCFVVFDVLMVNDTNLANCPLKDRAEQLKKCVCYELLTMVPIYT